VDGLTNRAPLIVAAERRVGELPETPYVGSPSSEKPFPEPLRIGVGVEFLTRMGRVARATTIHTETPVLFPEDPFEVG
jgi:hypothetical protein